MSDPADKIRDDLWNRRHWACKHLGPGVRMSGTRYHAEVFTPVRTVHPFIGPYENPFLDLQHELDTRNNEYHLHQ